jgi:hypothetical protein
VADYNRRTQRGKPIYSEFAVAGAGAIFGRDHPETLKRKAEYTPFESAAIALPGWVGIANASCGRMGRAVN